MDPKRNTDPETSGPDLARTLRALRADRGLSLAELSEASGIPQSTLSKVENREMSLNFDKLVRLAQALRVPVADLFGEPSAPAHQATPNGRRVIDPWSEPMSTVDHYRFRFLCTELKSRRMAPIYYEVGDRDAALDPGRPGEVALSGIIGERFAFVLEGPIEFHSTHYEMRVLQTGDSIYVDASMPHAFVSGPGVRGRLLSVVTSGDEAYMDAVRAGAAEGDADITRRLRQKRSRP